jgi:steroid delta-isomerase-like uncharacterized protein
MTEGDLSQIARTFIRAWAADGPDVIERFAAPNLTVSYTHFPEPIEGPDAFRDMLDETHSYFPDLEVDVDRVVTDTPHAVVRWTYRGTFMQGTLFGVPADGQVVAVTGMTEYRIEDGLVRREEGVVDNFNLMMQVGAHPTPATEEAE